MNRTATRALPIACLFAATPAYASNSAGHVDTLERLQVGIATLLLLIGFWALGSAYRSAWQILKPNTGTERLFFWGAIGAAAVARWLLAPLQLATIFIGYRWTQQAIDLYPIAHYGAGALVFYHWLLQLLPHDHNVLMAINAVVAVATLPLYGALAARIYNDRRVGWVMMGFVALTPLFIRNATSDANNIPMLLWLVGGLVNWQEYLKEGRRKHLFATAALLTLASITRPETIAVAGGVALFLAWGEGRLRSAFRDPMVRLAVVLAAILLVPHALHIFSMIGDLQGRDSLPAITVLGTAWGIVRTLLFANVLIRPDLYPAGLWICIIGAALWGSARKPTIALALAASLSVGILWSDIDEANMARVEVPAAIFATAVGAYGAIVLGSRYARGVIGGLIGVVIATAAFTGAILWQPTNEATEETLIREAVEHLGKGEDLTLIRNAHQDYEGQSRHAHEHFPGYLFGNNVDIKSQKQWAQSPDWTKPTYFFWGVRCYAQFRDREILAPGGEDLQPPCKRIRSKYTLTPVFERTIPNHGDVWINYYGDAQSLRVGLYKVSPKK